ncbi:hypothetical protein OF83DRAFT_452339 [Amylostereum chailletii]|nr:hypothetical protein OF83DRAFT_452339 [Amylostereum chailletii]
MPATLVRSHPFQYPAFNSFMMHNTFRWNRDTEASFESSHQNGEIEHTHPNEHRLHQQASRLHISSTAQAPCGRKPSSKNLGSKINIPKSNAALLSLKIRPLSSFSQHTSVKSPLGLMSGSLKLDV